MSYVHFNVKFHPKRTIIKMHRRIVKVKGCYPIVLIVARSGAAQFTLKGLRVVQTDLTKGPDDFILR